MGKRKKGEEEEQAAERIPSDLLPEVLARVPYRSLCRFKCVSTAWLALCSDPAVRRRSPQTLSGFFCYPHIDGVSGRRDEGLSFLNLSGRGRPLVDPSLPFLGNYKNVILLNCCADILLCQGWNRTTQVPEYFVCNPATDKIWAVLPALDVPEPQVPYIYMVGQHVTWSCKFCLCFNPAVPSRFVVFAFVERGHTIVAVRVYSSDTGEWTSTESGGHIVAYGVNTDGDTWRRIPMPPEVHFSFIGHSQGHLYGMGIEHVNDCVLSVWALKDYPSGKWTLKHTASILKLVGRSYRELGEQYMVAAVHPECNLIFLVGWMRSQETLMSYDMDSQKLNVICTLDDYHMSTLRPYIPCFAEWPPSDAH
uniref:F-box domain-containing protein n=1 Tax=Triticum urartu TaxID=4572 RepID=A0A8R7TB04_TRIUA